MTSGDLDSIIYNGQIESVVFSISGSDDNIKLSNVDVLKKDLFQESNIPVPNGAYDAHMGTTDYQWDCQTCGNSKKLCPGHMGSYKLYYPLQSPLFVKDIIRILKIICFNCGLPIVDLTKFAKYPNNKKIIEIVKSIGNSAGKAIICTNCGHNNPQITPDKNNDLMITGNYYGLVTDSITKKAKLERQERIYNHQIYAIFDKISDDTCRLLGRDPEMNHPRKLILSVIPAPPNTVRPDIRKIGGTRSSNDDITSLFKNIIAQNQKLPEIIPDVIDPVLDSKYIAIDLTYYNMIKGHSAGSTKNRATTDNNNSTLTSFASHLPRKPGRIRSNLLATRAFNMMRSNISCDNNLRIDEVGVPISLAKNIQLPETVQHYNMDRMMMYFLNGTRKYPGCKRVIKKDGSIYYADEVNKDFKIEIGDTIMRDIIDGDYMYFNRNPSLLYCSIMCHKIVVMETGDTLRLNVSACVFYNADQRLSIEVRNRERRVLDFGNLEAKDFQKKYESVLLSSFSNNRKAKHLAAGSS